MSRHARAAKNENLNQTLSNRKDVPDDFKSEIFWRVSWAMRDEILSRMPNLDDAEVTKLVEETQRWLSTQKTKPDLKAAEGFIIRKEKLSQLDSGFVLKLMREGREAETIVGIGRMAKIDYETARDALQDPTAERLVIICRALEMPEDIFFEICDLADDEGKRSPDGMADLLDVYRRIAPESAQRALRFLRTRKNLQHKIAGA